MKKSMVLAGTLAAALACKAEFGVTGTSVTIGDASRQVKIEYTLGDVPAIVTVDVKTNGTSIGSANITHLSGDVNRLVTKTGGATCTAYWQADKSWPGQDIAAADLTFDVVAWATNRPPDYCTVNLKNGDVRYYTAADQIPGGITNDMYKSDFLVMRYISAAGVSWYMGSTWEKGRQADRETYQKITLTNDYYMGVYEFTQGQWTKFLDLAFMTNSAPVMTADGIGVKSGKNVAYVGSFKPVCHFAFAHLRESSNGTANASHDWPAAPSSESLMGRLRTLVASTGNPLAFDLPSEAQWEFACRAGTIQGQWNDGSEILAASGADANLSNLAYYNTQMYGTTNVGSKVSNKWGLYDMHGNVRELCLDYYEPQHPYPDEHGDVCVVATDQGHVLRGGQADVGNCQYLRSAARSYLGTTPVNEQNGFRVVAVMP